MMSHASAALSRRRLLALGGVSLALAHFPRPASAAAARDPRLIVVVLRGALDGLSAVAPIGDPDYVALRGALALSPIGDKPALPLDGFFALHPAMPVFARLYKEGRASVVHAVATSYRDRSHFDGQDVLESGYAGPGHTESGWLNRAVFALQAAEPARRRGLGVGAAPPLVMRGPAPTLGWAPQVLPPAGEDLAQRVLDLYTHSDPVLGAALRAGLDADRIAAAGGLTGDMAKARGGMDQPNGMRQAAMGAARLLATPDGPRVAALAFDGWDTHANENGLLATRLAGLDGALEEFEKGLGEAWKDTAVVAITEFGRTARINGTGGTDHGAASVAFLAGGAVKGARIIADWPGLKTSQLYQGRDLAPTHDLRAVLKGLLADQFGLPAQALAEKAFPDSAAVAQMSGLIAG
ncbi:DUF1501 domain-containing protein [Methylosinus sp.]|jgi:uncharacterized protein (DUF1501 family)|uniref:DUF1501 domain-containing protein n=1 Tax=Methylosinus sp. TaxID=427 RepID=UPI0039C946F7